jgi:hypothetical protein
MIYYIIYFKYIFNFFKTGMYSMFFQCFNLLLRGLILVQIFMCIQIPLYFLLTRSPEVHP